MSAFSKTLTLTSNGFRPAYFDITAEVRQAVMDSGIKTGTITVTTCHTTCAVLFEEMVHDKNWYGDETLQVDLNDLMDRLVPVCTTEGQYHYPGELHAKFAEEVNHDDRIYTLNGDAHLRASLIGNSKSFALIDGEAQLGKVGYVYFIDWDHQRVRQRKCFIQIVGD